MKNQLRLKMCLFLFSCLMAVMAQAQSFVLSGIVQDENGEPLIGVNVYVKDKPGVGMGISLCKPIEVINCSSPL